MAWGKILHFHIGFLICLEPEGQSHPMFWLQTPSRCPPFAWRYCWPSVSVAGWGIALCKSDASGLYSAREVAATIRHRRNSWPEHGWWTLEAGLRTMSSYACCIRPEAGWPGIRVWTELLPALRCYAARAQNTSCCGSLLIKSDPPGHQWRFEVQW